MVKKQLAIKSFSGGDAFTRGVEALKTACDGAHRAIERAEQEFGREIPELQISRNRDMTELRLGLLLHLQASCAWTAPGVECRASADALRYGTDSGLSFGWDRWSMDPGYTFWVKHPSGAFPPQSTLRATLKAAGWRIESYDGDGNNVTGTEVENV